VKLYTFQKPARWVACCQRGNYIADSSFIFVWSMMTAYIWMLDQYKKPIREMSDQH